MKKILFIMSVLLIISGISIYLYSYHLDKLYKEEDKKLVQDFFESNDDNKNNAEEEIKNEKQVKSYMAVIEIPKISLKTGIVMSSEDYSTMNRNVSIYPSSDMPNVDNGNFILFGHSGTGRIAYFKNISKLKIGNEIYIYYKDYKYVYKVINNYDVSMYDKTPLNKMEDKSIVTLITCKKGNNKFRTVIVGELIEWYKI